MKLKLVALGVFVSALLSFAIPASGITFGREVTNGSTAYPSVVSIWYSENAADDASFICTGTLIQPRIVLTAAHCVLSTGLYYVQYGADQLYDEMDLLEVSATWKNPRYSASQLVNDTGLLLLKDSIPGAITTRLPLAAEIKSIQANKNVKYEIVGWGKDQNDEPASYLRKAAVDDQTTFMKKYKAWRNDIWFAVGKWNNKEKVFAGSCNGDSGGPLFATVGSKTILAGITSWGAEDCETAVPSVYVRLSYYIDTIKNSGIPTLLVNETKQNRALPSVVVEPRIQGTAKSGSVLTCDTGQWSSNTVKVSFVWSGSGIPTGYSGSTVSVTANNGSSAKEYVCTIKASNSNGTVERQISVSQSPPPSGVARPSILNMPNIASEGSITVSCNPGTFNNSSSVSNEWWISGVLITQPFERVGTGNTFSITMENFKNWGGKYLYCKTLAVGDGGTGSLDSTGYVVPAFARPSVGDSLVLSGMPKDGFSVNPNNQVTCSGGSATGLVTTTEYTWLLRENSYATSGTLIGTGQSISLNSDWFQTNGNKNLVCKFTATGPGGQVYSQVSANVFWPALHSISSVSVKGIPDCWAGSGCDWVNVVASCEALSSAGSSGNYIYTWRIYDLSVPYNPTASSPFQQIGTGKSLVLTEAILKQAVLKKIGCTASLTTGSGTATGYSSATYIDYRNIVVADVTAPTFNFISISPYNGPTYRLRDPFTIKFSFSDSSGLSPYSPFSFRFILNGTSEPPVSSNGTWARVSGDTTSGTYEISFIFPSSATGGKLGSYQILARATDAKSNSTSWLPFATFEVTGERTN